MNNEISAQNARHTPKWEKIAGYVFGVVFISLLLALNIYYPNPTPTQYDTFKIVLALAAAGVGGILSGFIHVEGTFNQLAIRAGGALALFVIVFFFNPAMPPQPTNTVIQTIHGDNGVQIYENTGVINIGPVDNESEDAQP